MLNSFLTREQKQFSGGETAFSTDGTGATGKKHPLAKNMNLDLSLTFTQN